MRPKKCPRCNSTKIRICGDIFYCSKCGFRNQIGFHFHLKDKDYLP
jgi:ribosomal protein L37AE/L43A